MPRPVTIDDVKYYHKLPTPVFRIETSQLTRHPEVAAALMAAIKRVQLDPALEFDPDTGECARPLTPEQLQDVLEGRQKSWDNEKLQYDEYMADPTSQIETWRVNTVRQFAEAEGLPFTEPEEN